MTRLFPLAGACALAGLIPHAPAAAQTVQDRAPAVTAPATPIAAEAMPDDQRYAVHGQATVVLQATPGFASPYAGANSLTPRQAKETVDVTLYAGVRPWAGGELWVNPEIDQGFGLSNTLGVAGFPSAEAYKVGRTAPYTRLQRLFLRQTIDLGGAREAVAGFANQLAGSRTANRLVLTIGKFGVGDVFDTNIYAHDPRADFLNWSAVDTGSFDYAADAWGYSTGIAAEWYRAAWTLRLGAFNLSKVPNGETLERGFGQYQLDAEVEHRHQLAGRPGAVRVTLFRNRGRFGRFDEVLALAARTGDVADTGLVRSRRTRAGIGINVEQAASDTLGVFARAGIADGQVEPYDFTDIDRTAQAGLSLRGAGWGRSGDTLGAVVIVNAISRDHQRYLDAGGLGVLVGDGRLPNPGAERIGEAYYKIAAARGVELTVDYQFIANPGYNRDRGPANVFAFRAHGAF
ncbi:porin [Sphingomonas melonis TY]|jgi:high affinity Mn2+ porin|nr:MULTISPECIES: carbohydrate porin [Sphingomonas]AOW25371.1 carbohydrate porin [Sphingomonas melonis TY]KZB93922.1 porin [Sphingomonas melonis TY]MBI0532096.1 carbohydrate porin [Sphingomonas sp. TX0522]MBX8846264.1 carbohydrate porin [Sphingomonas melonis]MBX8855342.1 carbohydrate porin [Sphingomonas melonis]